MYAVVLPFSLGMKTKTKLETAVFPQNLLKLTINENLGTATTLESIAQMKLM